MRRLFQAWAALLVLGALRLVAGEVWNHPPRRLAADVRHETFHSAVLRTEVGYNICLPPHYATNASQRFPVIYYLHGYEGHESSYLEYADYWRKAVAARGPVILVFVNGGATSFFSDAPDGSVPGETLVVKELIPHIDQKFRTLTNAAGRSLHGYSMGGFGALKLACKFPDTFGSVVAYGATLGDAAEFKKQLGKVFTKMFGDDLKRFAENDPLTLAEGNADKIRARVAISLVIGTKDEFLERNRALHEKLQALKIPHRFEEVPRAGHDKDELYEPAALRGFQFSLEWGQMSREGGEGSEGKRK